MDEKTKKAKAELAAMDGVLDVLAELGLRYFELLAMGECPYCGRALVPAREVADALFEQAARPPDEMLDSCKACAPCKSVWSEPVFSDAGDAVAKMRRVWRSRSKKGRH